MGSMPKLGGEIPTELQSVSEVALLCDIVTIKHRPGFMAGDVHGDAFGYPGAHQVAHSGPSQIVKL